MLRVILGIAVALQAGAAYAEGAGAGEAKAGEADDSAVHVACPPGSADEDCTADEVAVPEGPNAEPAPPSVAPAAPTAVTAVAPKPVAFATVAFRNDVGKKLRLVEAQFSMDGEKLPVVLTSAEPGKSYVIVSGPMKPGPHVVTARLAYRGDSGVFSYMKGYKLNVKSDQVLTAPADRTVNFTVVGHENKGMTVPLERRVVVNVEDSGRSK
jgi:hypothetical protein